MLMSYLKRASIGAVLAIAAATCNAAPTGYKLGSVWNLAMISVEPGRGDEYIASLREYYTTVMEQAVSEKAVVSYKLLQGARSNPQDFNFMIMIESPNWASYDQLPDKLEAIAGKLAGSVAKAEDAARTGFADRTKVRTVFGGKNMQEIVFTK
jgi:hypothetical protein